MYRLAFAMLGIDGDAHDAVQDAFLGVAARWESVDNPAGYLRVSVVNGVRKQMRTRARRAMAENKMRAEFTGSGINGDDYLVDVLDGLPDRQRVAVVLTYCFGMNSTEAGELMDCPAATVRSLVHRALIQLRAEVSR
jgi:RNA polymerase sigma factor (sigma-70 family)